MRDRIPPVAEGDEVSASWLNALRELVLSIIPRFDPSGGIVGYTGPGGTVISGTPGNTLGMASYAVSAAGIGAGVAGTAELLAPNGTSRGFATVTNGWHSAIDPGVRFLVVRDIGGGWIAGPYECTVA